MRPRFSLRTFLITVALFATAFGAFAFWRQSIIDRTQRHLKAMDDLDLQKGVMVAKKPHPNTAYINFVRKWIHPRAYEVTERVCASKSFWTQPHLQLLKDLNGLSNITCSFDRFTRRDAEELCAIPQLVTLYIQFKESEEGAAELLASKTTLKQLAIGGKCGPAFFQALDAHPNLTYLRLRETPMTKDDVQAVASIPHLSEFTTFVGIESDTLPILLTTKLKLLVTPVRNLDAGALAELSNSQVEQLYLTSPLFPAGTLASAAKTPKLRELALNGELEFAPGEFESLSECKNLERLELRSVWLTKEQWEVVTALPKLTHLIARSAESAQGCATKFLDSNPKRKFNGN
jgi:hypothetical protein